MTSMNADPAWVSKKTVMTYRQVDLLCPHTQGNTDWACVGLFGNTEAVILPLITE